jgi:hypothetical protein
MKRIPTAEQKQSAAARRERFRSLVKQVAQMSDEQRGEIVNRIGAVPTVEGRSLSPFNSCLILTQLPTASMVGGFQQWLRSGRAVRKGEHGLGIWVPTVAKAPEPEGDEAEVNFIMGTVFDIGQTQEVEQ